MAEVEQRTADEQLSLPEWERRFKAYIVERLRAPEWTREQAEEAAQNEFENVEVDLTDSPEFSAEECLSYWENDGE